jgi:hypothetical protein
LYPSLVNLIKISGIAVNELNSFEVLNLFNSNESLVEISDLYFGNAENAKWPLEFFNKLKINNKLKRLKIHHLFFKKIYRKLFITKFSKLESLEIIDLPNYVFICSNEILVINKKKSWLELCIMILLNHLHNRKRLRIALTSDDLPALFTFISKLKNLPETDKLAIINGIQRVTVRLSNADIDKGLWRNEFKTLPFQSLIYLSIPNYLHLQYFGPLKSLNAITCCGFIDIDFFKSISQLKVSYVQGFCDNYICDILKYLKSNEEAFKNLYYLNFNRDTKTLDIDDVSYEDIFFTKVFDLKYVISLSAKFGSNDEKALQMIKDRYPNVEIVVRARPIPIQKPDTDAVKSDKKCYIF